MGRGAQISLAHLTLAHPFAPRPSGIASIAGNLARSACRVALPCSLAHPCRVARMHQHYAHALLAPRPSGIASIAGNLARSACRVALPCSLQGWRGCRDSRLADLRLEETRSEKNLRPGHRPLLRSQPFSSQPARFLPLRLSPPLPLLLCSRNAAHASLLSFCTSFSQLSRYGLATPSSHDGCCAGAPICRQPVLRTLCFTK